MTRNGWCDSASRRTSGFTLIELMTALALGLVILAAAMSFLPEGPERWPKEQEDPDRPVKSHQPEVTIKPLAPAQRTGLTDLDLGNSHSLLAVSYPGMDLTAGCMDAAPDYDTGRRGCRQQRGCNHV